MEIVSMMMLITFRHELTNEAILMFAMASLDALLVNIIWFTIAAFVGTKSSHLMNKFKSDKTVYIRKCFKSCLQLKIRFGNNFIDKDTPLIIQNFCFSTLGSMLIMR